MGAPLLGCSTASNLASAVPDALARSSLVYRPEVQQGNVVTQEMINQLRPGMSRSQIKYLLGTPLLVDVFHQDRWDYYYSLEEQGKITEKYHTILYFQNDQLASIEGDFRPMAQTAPPAPKETVFDVPDYTEQNKGFFRRTLEKAGVVSEE